MTEAMACVARHVGKLGLEHRAQVAVPVVEWLGARCGSGAIGLHTYFYLAEVPARVPTREIFEQWQPQLGKVLESVPPNARLGAWFGRGQGRASFVLVYGEIQAVLDAVHRVGDELRIQGRSLVAAEAVAAHVTQGPHTVSSCELRVELATGRFEGRCPLEASDPYAWVDITVQKPGRVLSSGVFSFMLPVAGTLPEKYEDPLQLTPSVAETASEVSGLLLDVVNTVRARAKLPALTEAEAQSEVAQRATPRYLQSTSLGDPVTEEIALGLMAGWAVGVPIARAGFFASRLDGTMDVAQLATAIFMRPLGRAVIMDPTTDTIALGAVANPELPRLGATLTTFERFGLEDRAVERQRAWASIQRAREALGRPPLREDTELSEDIVSLVRTLETQNRHPEDILDAMLDYVAQVERGTQITGFYSSATSFEGLTAPLEHVASLADRAGFAVARYAPKHEPRASWMVFVVGPAGHLTARLGDGAVEVRSGERLTERTSSEL